MVLNFGISRNIISHHMNNIYKSLQKFCANFVTIICIFLFMICISAILFKPTDNTINVLVINVGKGVTRKTSENYLSIGLDSSVIADGFFGFDINNPQLIAVTKHLSPGLLRVGGTLADRLRFVSDNSQVFKSTSITDIDGGSCSHESKCCTGNRPNFTMSGEEWLKLNNYAHKSGFTILFDLNALIRYDNGTWDSRNAKQLIKFSDHHNLTLVWQLGNEPNSFRHVFNYAVNASQLAADFKELRLILDMYDMYKNSLLVGPDTTRPQPRNDESTLYLESFLDNIGNAIDVVTWHQYYMNGRTASLRDFVNPAIFDLLKEQAQIVTNLAQKDQKPIWLTETASAYGGGSPGYSNSYIGTFIWLDKLGLAAKEGVDLVVRQSIYKGFYALVDSNYEPNPDWWISVLYKKLVGPKLISYDFVSTDDFRLYCQCSSKEVLNELGPSITIFGVNLRSYPGRVRLQGIGGDGYKANTNQWVKAFVLSGYNSILSRYIRLNGNLLQMNGRELPHLIPIMYKAEPYLSVPPFSSVFWIVSNPVFKYCL